MKVVSSTNDLFLFMDKTSISIIITAGGLGKRMGGNYPKQFIPIAGKSILHHTLSVVTTSFPKAEIILTLPSEWQEEWLRIAREESMPWQVKIVDGGLERYHSVKNALSEATGEVVFVHDGVRPLVHSRTLISCLKEVEIGVGVIPVMPVIETLRKSDGLLSETVDRKNYHLVQTPQVFVRKELIEAYKQDYTDGFTDDASVFEKNGGRIVMVAGNKENIKITTQEDLEWAEYLLKSKGN